MSEYVTLHSVMMVGGALALLVMIVAWIRVMDSDTNTLEWSHLISTKAADGTQYADWNKIGQGCGVVISVWLPTVYAYSPDMEATGLAAVLGVVLLYLGGVSGYAATLRARQGTTVTTTEPAPPPAGATKTTVTETPPKG